jgi:hypothetical protein
MKRKYLLLMAVLVANHALAATEESPKAKEYKAPGWQAPPSTVKDWADRCTDFTVNGWSFKDPKNFPLMVNTFTEPSIYLELAQRVMDPQFFIKMLGSMAEPDTAKNYMEWGDPAIYARWAGAPFDPNFYTAMMRPFGDPGKYMRWMVAPLDPRWWGVAINTMNPEVWLKWMTAPVDPKTYEVLAKMSDPDTARQWSQVLSDPDSYPAWSSSWAATPPGNADAQSGLPNPFDPKTWAQPYPPSAPSSTGQK